MKFKAKMPFGKYQGELLSVIAKADRSYLLWLLNSKVNINMSLRADIKEVLK